jgi:hypothetical protein
VKKKKKEVWESEPSILQKKEEVKNSSEGEGILLGDPRQRDGISN